MRAGRFLLVCALRGLAQWISNARARAIFAEGALEGMFDDGNDDIFNELELG